MRLMFKLGLEGQLEVRTQHMPDMEYSLCKDIGPKKIGQVNNSQRLNNRVKEGVAA